MGTIKRKPLKSIRALYRHTNSKCTLEVIQIVTENLFIGLPATHCCHLAGISVDTFYRWCDEGQKYLEAKEDEEVPNSWELSAEFYLAIHKSIALWQKKKIEQSLDCERFNMNWSRDLTLLQRRDRTNWGANNTSDTNGSTSTVSDDRFL